MNGQNTIEQYYFQWIDVPQRLNSQVGCSAIEYRIEISARWFLLQQREEKFAGDNLFEKELCFFFSRAKSTGLGYRKSMHVRFDLPGIGRLDFCDFTHATSFISVPRYDGIFLLCRRMDKQKRTTGSFPPYILRIRSAALRQEEVLHFDVSNCELIGMQGQRCRSRDE